MVKINITSNTILVTGASGFVGRALCAELIRRGYDVRGAIRTPLHSARLPCEHVTVADIGKNTDWSGALSGVDVVVHLAARVHVMRETAGDPLTAFREVNVVGTERLARAAASSGIKRLVYVSSIKVNGEATDSNPFTEEDAPSPQDSYGISKFEAELALRRVAHETGLEIVIVRPPLVYGPGVGGNFWRLLKLVERGIPLPLASVENRRSMIYLGNFVDVLTACTSHPDAAGKTFLVSDGEDISTAQLIRNLARLMGKPPYLWPFPPTLLRLVGRSVGRLDEVERLLGSLVIDSSKIRRELGWTPPFPMEQGIAETVKWFQMRSNRA